MEVIMLNLSVFSHNHHPSGVNLLAKYIRRGIRVIIMNLLVLLVNAIGDDDVLPFKKN